MTYKVEFIREECLGCGACTMCDNWELSYDGKATPIKTEIDKIGCNKDAVDICPVQIIKIVEI